MIGRLGRDANNWLSVLWWYLAWRSPLQNFGKLEARNRLLHSTSAWFSLRAVESSPPGQEGRMEYAAYLRELAAQYRELAEKRRNSPTQRELLDLADTCEEVACQIEDRSPAG